MDQRVKALEAKVSVLEKLLKSMESYTTFPRTIADALKTRIGHFISIKVTLDIGSTTANNQTSTTVSLPGAAVNDPVFIGPPASSSVGRGEWSAYVSSVDIVTVIFNNHQSSGSLDPGSGEFTISVFKPAQ